MLSFLFASASLGERVLEDGIGSIFGSVFNVAKVAYKFTHLVQHTHGDAMERIVDLARSRVPVDTGALLNGITWEDHGGYVELRASAHKDHPNGKRGEDYAHFLEFGTAAGLRGGAIDHGAKAGLFSLPADVTSAYPTGATTSRTRRQYRSDPGTEAQPFFYNSAEDVLGDLTAYQDDLAAAITDEGYDSE